MVELTEKQVQALKITHDVLVRIRRLAREPVSAKTMAAIHDLADSVHNVPDVVTRRPENPNLASMFDEELDRDLATASGVYKREGLPAFVFPQEIQPLDVDVSAYTASGARFHVRAEVNLPSTTPPNNSTCPGARKRSSLALLLQRIFGVCSSPITEPSVGKSAASAAKIVPVLSKYPDIVLDIFKAIRALDDYEQIKKSCNEIESGIAVPVTVFAKHGLPASKVLQILEANNLIVEFSSNRKSVILHKAARDLLFV